MGDYFLPGPETSWCLNLLSGNFSELGEPTEMTVPLAK